MPRRKTDEQFKQEVYNLVGNEYTFIDPYVNAKTKIMVKHNKCGNTYEVQPDNFIHGSRCPYCSGLIKKTDKQFRQEVKDLVGNEYVFLEHYQGTKTKIRVKHNKCRNIYEVTPGNFIGGNRCPYCFNKGKRKTDKQFRQEVYDLVSNEYTFLDSYIDSMTKIRVKHNKCGNIYGVIPNNFLRGDRCPYCLGLAKKTDKQFKEEIYNLVGDEYTFLDSYVNSYTKLLVKHNKCGNVYEVTPHSFFRGCRCPYCFGTPKKSNEEFKKEIYDLVGNEYTFLDSYIDSMTKIRVKHNKCGNTYEVTPNCFLEGHGCPYCNSPKGELIINRILKSLGIDYEAQKTFDDLKDKSYLSYDFYIPSQNILIEYQGIQHYQPVVHFGGEDKFKIQQKHDCIKLDYAKELGYKLITVPYTEDTLSKIKKYLIKHGLKQ